MKIFRMGSLLALAALLVLGGRIAVAAPVDWGDVLGAKSPPADPHSPTAKPAATQPAATHTIKPLATVGPTRTPAATQAPASTATHARTATGVSTRAPSPPRGRKPASAPPPKPAKPAPTLQSEFPSAGR